MDKKTQHLVDAYLSTVITELRKIAKAGVASKFVKWGPVADELERIRDEWRKRQ